MNTWILPSFVDYFDARVDVVASTAERLTGLPREEADAALEAIGADVRAKVEALSDEDLRNVAVAVADDLYKTLNRISIWGPETDRYVRAVFGTFFDVLHGRGYLMRYVADNVYEEGLQRPLFLYPLAYSAAGLVYVCPHENAYSLMKRDGALDESDGELAQASMVDLSALAPWLAEGRLLAKMLIEAAADRQMHHVYLELDFEAGALDAVWNLSTPPGTIVVFRNEAPVLGSLVDVRQF